MRHSTEPTFNNCITSKSRERSCRKTWQRRLTIGVVLVFAIVVAGLTQSRVPRVKAQSTIPTAHTFGEQRVLVGLVNFQDKAIQPFTINQVTNVMSNSSNLFYENSYHQAWLRSDVFGWFTLPLSYQSCDINAIRQASITAVAAAGVDVNNYSRYVFIFPQNACSFPALEWHGTNILPTVLVNNTLTVRTISHELGHSFGSFHSQSLDCGTVSVGSTCTTSDYGDSFDVMGGNQSTAHLNAYQKERLGWLNAGTSPPIATIESSGTYFIEPLETLGAGGPKALKILKSVDPVTGDKMWYYVECRRPIGLDSSLSSNANIQNGVVIHQGVTLGTYTGHLFLPSHLLDMTPETSSWLDPALVVGRTFTDPVSGVSITPQSVGNSGATIFVNLNSNLPTPTPTPTATPTPTPTPAPTPVTLTVSVNTDRTSYVLNETVTIRGVVRTGTSAVPGATVNFTIRKANGSTTSMSATTGTDGIAVVKYRLKKQDPKGTYQDTASSNVNGGTGSASSNFVVQ